MSERPLFSTGIRLQLLPSVFAICRLPPDAPIPPLAERGLVRSMTVTEREISIVCEESQAPEGAEVDGDWRALYVAGPMPFDLAGVVASIVSPLSAAGLGVFVLSTYESDVVLVRGATLDRAMVLLRDSGHELIL